MSREITEEAFLKDVAAHQMQILRDDGVNRHVRFREPGTISMGFDLITWPGHLCYTGDMGTFVFSRLEDMFQFFRTNGPGLRINDGYWAQKLLAMDRGGLRNFDGDKFSQRLRADLEQYIEASSAEWDADYPAELRQRFDDEVSAYADDGEHEARRAAEEFEVDGEQVFTDLWEHDFTEYTDCFVWCCYALAWGVQQYDAAKATAEVPV